METVDIEGCVCSRHDRTDGRQAGGVVCYVRQDLPFTLLKPADNSGVQSLWPLYGRSVSHIVFGVVYHPPVAVNHITTAHISDNIHDIIRQHSSAVSDIVGDFNKMTDNRHRQTSAKASCSGSYRPKCKSAILDDIYTDIGQWYINQGNYRISQYQSLTNRQQ